MNCLPYFCTGPIVKGFGRGSKELGCPTGEFRLQNCTITSEFDSDDPQAFYCYLSVANVPQEVVQQLPAELETGVYFGWANVENGEVHKAVLSIGWNPFYDNKEKSMVCDSKSTCLFDVRKKRKQAA